MSNNQIQVSEQAAADVQVLKGMYAVTFKPAEGSPSFAAQPIRPAGQLEVLVFDTQEGFPRLRIFGGTPSRSGAMYYGGCRLEINLADLPSGFSKRFADVLRTANAMVEACRRQAHIKHKLEVLPTMPRVWTAFEPGREPAYRPNAAVKQIAASRLRKHPDRLPGGVLMDRMFQNIYEEFTLQPGTPGNPFGQVSLVLADLLDESDAGLAVYEDLREFNGVPAQIGAVTWNPAEKVIKRTFRPTRNNPARQVLAAAGVAEDEAAFNAVDLATLDKMLKAMRRHLGLLNEVFSQDCLMFALHHPEQATITADTTVEEMISFIGEPAMAKEMRKLLPPGVGAECTDADLLVAAKNAADRKLVASGLPRVQVLHLPRELRFTEADMSARITVDFTTGVESIVEAHVDQPAAELVPDVEFVEEVQVGDEMAFDAT